MALKLYNETDIEAIADAIRGKNGSSDTYKVSEMADAIDDIPTGGGGLSIDDFLMGTNYPEIVVTSATKLKPYAFLNNTTIKEFYGESIGGSNNGQSSFQGCTNLEKVSLPLINTTGNDCFNGCTKLTSISLPSCTKINQREYANCTSLKTFVSSSANLSQHIYDQAFTGCAALEAIDLTSGDFYRANIFTSCTSLDTIILRASSVIAMSNNGALNTTPFASGGSGGTLYVPASLISAYQSATNWSTILGYTNNQIKSIESTHTDPDAPIDLTTHYADGTLISS